MQAVAINIKMNCKCFHHGVVKVMMALAGLSALGFWWASAFDQTLLWMDTDHFFKDTVVLSLLVMLTRYCGCCGGGAGMCGHDDSCKCGDCGTCK